MPTCSDKSLEMKEVIFEVHGQNCRCPLLQTSFPSFTSVTSPLSSPSVVPHPKSITRHRCRRFPARPPIPGRAGPAAGPLSLCPSRTPVFHIPRSQENRCVSWLASARSLSSVRLRIARPGGAHGFHPHNAPISCLVRTRHYFIR